MEDQNTENYANGFSAYKEHSTRHREDSELITFDILRRVHPDYHVTRTAPSKCDLLGFAAAGHASATRDDNETYDALRAYNAPSARLDNQPGVLNDEVKFARWSYFWKEHSYLVYETEWSPPFMPVKKLLFVLSPRSQRGNFHMHHEATDALLLAAGAWSSDLHEEIYVFDDARWTKDKQLWKSVQHASWDEVILNRDMKTNLIKDVQGFFDNQELYKKLAVPWKRGVILHGVPGNGKTISIKALINSLASRPEPIPSLYVKSFDSCNGPKRSIRSIFTRARAAAPCLLIFEDLDSLVEQKTRSYFLNEVDGLESNNGILMVGSTNHLDHLDPAIANRPSRFDRKYHFKIPIEQERIAYCQYWKAKLENSDMVEFPEELCSVVAKMTDGFSFAYMKELFIVSLLAIARGSVDGFEAEVEEASDSSSSSDGVVVALKDVVTDGEPTTRRPDGDGKLKTLSEKPKRRIPQVGVPEELQDNLFLRAVQLQSQLLLDEMDNTAVDDAPSGKEGIGGKPLNAAAALRAAKGLYD